MPHIIIEYSQVLENKIDSMLMINAAHKGAFASGLFEESHIKSRVIAYEYYKTGISDLRFIHITQEFYQGVMWSKKVVYPNLS